MTDRCFLKGSESIGMEFVQPKKLLKGCGKVRQEEGTSVPARGWRFLFKDSRQLMLLAAWNVSFTFQELHLYLHAKMIPPPESALGQVISYLALSHTSCCCEFNSSTGTAPDCLHVHSPKYSSSIFPPIYCTSHLAYITAKCTYS